VRGMLLPMRSITILHVYTVTFCQCSYSLKQLHHMLTLYVNLVKSGIVTNVKFMPSMLLIALS
jgi:hypothetical protein